TGTHLVEHRLEAMRERGDILEAERGTATLDRVRHAEDRVDALRIGGTDVELQERRLHGVERLEALFEEHTVELGEIERHACTDEPAGAAKPSASVRSRSVAASVRQPGTSSHSTPR